MNAIQIDQNRLSRFLTEAHLRKGAGSGANGKIDVCVMQAVDWLAGGDGKTDAHDCADPVIAKFCIRLNDAPRFAEWRDELKPFAPRIALTRNGPETIRKRGFMCADWAVRTVAPMAFDFWADQAPSRASQVRALAQELRDVPPVTDEKSARFARETAKKAQSAAAYDADAAYAAYAAAAAAAAYAAAAAAAVDAVSAVSAVSARSKSNDFSRKLWDESLRFLDQLIAVTEKPAA